MSPLILAEESSPYVATAAMWQADGARPAVSSSAATGAHPWRRARRSTSCHSRALADPTDQGECDRGGGGKVTTTKGRTRHAHACLQPSRIGDWNMETYCVRVRHPPLPAAMNSTDS